MTIHGVEVHPGFAKGKLVNAARLAARVIAALPSDTLTPETTEGREGFCTRTSSRPTAVKARVRVILRDFDDDALADHERLLRRTAEEVVRAEPRARLEIESRTSTRTCAAISSRTRRSWRQPNARSKPRASSVLHRPIRGGTDGSVLSARGLPTPNVFAGGHEFHSVREWVSVQDMAAAAAVVVRLAGEWAGRAPH